MSLVVTSICDYKVLIGCQMIVKAPSNMKCFIETKNKLSKANSIFTSSVLLVLNHFKSYILSVTSAYGEGFSGDMLTALSTSRTSCKNRYYYISSNITEVIRLLIRPVITNVIPGTRVLAHNFPQE